jgi:hypothetical protein
MTEENNKNSAAPENSDYHVRPWMISYLPKSPSRRDAVMLFSAILIIDSLALILGFFQYIVLTAAVLALGHGHFVWHYYERMTLRWKHRK